MNHEADIETVSVGRDDTRLVVSCSCGAEVARGWLLLSLTSVADAMHEHIEAAERAS